MVAQKQSRLISLGVIASAHGIKGQVKIRSFTADPEDITAYGPLRNASGKEFKITLAGGTKDALIAFIEGITTREQAEALRNTELFVPRSALPDTHEHQYYHEDLVGLSLTIESGEPYGVIDAVHNFGAGDLIAVKRNNGEEEMLSFTRQTFPRVDLEKGTAVIVPPQKIE